MPRWSHLFHRGLPYTMGYVANQDTLEIYTIDQNLEAYRVMAFDSILEHKVEVITAFYNLGFVFRLMSKLYSRSGWPRLLPFLPDFKAWRSIEFMDGWIRRQVGVELLDVYKALQELSRTEGEKTHLQIVEKLEVELEADLVTVDLNPIGHADALKYWHGCNFCHGDICFDNMISIDTDYQHWVLIDMDKSRRPGTEVIRERGHPFRGLPLHFKHDLFQLDMLMDICVYEWTGGLRRIRTALVSAIDTPEVTAESVLALLDELELVDSGSELSFSWPSSSSSTSSLSSQ